MIDKDTVFSRLATIEQCMKVIEKTREKGLAHYLRNLETRFLTERALHLSIEAAIDIGNHIIANKGFRRPSDYADIFRILREEKIISEELCEKLVQMARFRSRLVHLYSTLDNEIVFSIIENEIADILEFAAVISKML